jgi:hypothetical protein
MQSESGLNWHHTDKENEAQGAGHATASVGGVRLEATEGAETRRDGESGVSKIGSKG